MLANHNHFICSWVPWVRNPHRTQQGWLVSAPQCLRRQLEDSWAGNRWPLEPGVLAVLSLPRLMAEAGCHRSLEWGCGWSLSWWPPGSPTPYALAQDSQAECPSSEGRSCAASESQAMTSAAFCWFQVSHKPHMTHEGGIGVQVSMER